MKERLYWQLAPSCSCSSCREQAEIDAEIARLQAARNRLRCAKEVGAEIARNAIASVQP